jgi:endonuclease G
MTKNKRKGSKQFSVSIFILLLIVAIVIIGRGNRDTPISCPEATHEIADVHETADVRNYLDYSERPQLENGRAEEIIEYSGYAVSYNPDYKIANWVAYELTAEEAASTLFKRASSFTVDPNLRGRSATDSDYRNSGYDRGHLAPAADMRWAAEAMRESFYFTNICPQNGSLNSGLWSRVESKCREWAIEHGAVLIATGPVIIDGQYGHIGASRVTVPDYFYKAICIVSNDKQPLSIGFVFENTKPTAGNFMEKTVSVDSLERLTGIDFFTTFPKSVQEEMEVSTVWPFE